jgi:hypothetical protein
MPARISVRLGLIGSGLFWAVAGCQDKRIDTAPPAERQIHIEAPGADVRVDTSPATPVAPRPGEGVDVNVGPGGVQVDVESTPLRDRIREKRSESPPK